MGGTGARECEEVLRASTRETSAKGRFDLLVEYVQRRGGGTGQHRKLRRRGRKATHKHNVKLLKEEVKDAEDLEAPAYDREHREREGRKARKGFEAHLL